MNDYNILFIDSPVGAGYSYTDSDHSFAKTNAQIGADLLNCIRRFLKKNPKFETVPTFIVGESYGGKMAAEFARVWYKACKTWIYHKSDELNFVTHDFNSIIIRIKKIEESKAI